MTTRPATFERSVIRSSVIPSAKYALSASPLMLSNGSTAIDGLPEGAIAPGAGEVAALVSRVWLDGRSHHAVPIAITNNATIAASQLSRRRTQRPPVAPVG